MRPDATTLLSGDDSERKPLTKDRVRIKMKMEVYVPTLEFLKRDHRLKEEDYKKLDKMKNVCSVSHSNFSLYSSIILAKGKKNK